MQRASCQLETKATNDIFLQIAGATEQPRHLVDGVPRERSPRRGRGLPAPLLPAPLPHGAGAADGAGGLRRAVRAAPRRHRPLQRQLAPLTLPDVTGENGL